MNKSVFALALLFVIACAPQPQEEVRFPHFLERVESLDAQFNTSYHNEALGHAMIAQENIAPYLAELIAQRQDLSEDLRDYDVMRVFLEARIAQLKAQDAFYDADVLWQELNPLESCSQAGKIQDAVILDATARDQAVYVMDAFDAVASTTYGVLIGINGDAPKWYASDFDLLHERIDDGKFFVREQCGLGYVA